MVKESNLVHARQMATLVEVILKDSTQVQLRVPKLVLVPTNHQSNGIVGCSHGLENMLFFDTVSQAGERPMKITKPSQKVFQLSNGDQSILK